MSEYLKLVEDTNKQLALDESIKLVEDTNKQLALDESINDKNLLKAVILAGGPGSGKSFIAEMAFKGIANFVASDVPFEMLLKKHDLSLNLDRSNEEEYAKQWTQRIKAKDLTTTKLYHWINGMLPLVIDGTGKNYEKIKQQQNELYKLGYDVGMVFVNTNLETALERNRQRERSLDDQVVTELWKDVQGNIGKFQRIFKNDMIIIDNNENLDKNGINELYKVLSKVFMQLIGSKLKNNIGVRLISKLKEVKGKYLSDILNVTKGLKI
jgi:dephospho-CoA kinase